MGVSTFTSLHIFILVFIFTSPACLSCLITSCPNNSATPVRFPFQLQEPQAGNCSYPGFNLHCTDQGYTALELPQSGQFLVRNINYQAQSIQLYDPGNCLARRLLDGLDPSGSHFQADSYMNYTFFSCLRNYTDARFAIIDCLSNSTRTIIATSLTILPEKMSNTSCQKIKTLQVPVSFLPHDTNGFTSSLTDDVLLSWNVPDCKDCEVKGGICGLQTNGNQQISCLYHPQGNPEDAQNGENIRIFRIVAFSIAIPAILSAVGVGVFLCITDRREAQGFWINRGQLNPVIPQPQDTVMGLDQATIDSYTKVVLGESRRVPGLNDGSCPICLSDFTAKETLRCVPDCQHCFHADCIDEWLRMNGTCPLCRNSPGHQLQA